MKKFAKIAFAAMLTIVFMVGFQSCEKENGGSIKGWYASSEESGYYGYGRYFYEFKSDNTVLDYNFMYRNINVNDGTEWHTVNVNGQTWYYFGSPSTYSYVTDGNTIIIPSMNRIFIKDGNKLIREGSSETYYKQ